MFQGFKNFILRGNAVDLAVGVVIGAAFSSVVNSIVKDLFTPLLGIFTKVYDFSIWSLTIFGNKILIGDLINNTISFLLTAIAVYVFVVIPMNKFLAKKPAPSTTKKCPECLSDIPLQAKRCSFCTQPVA